MIKKILYAVVVIILIVWLKHLYNVASSDVMTDQNAIKLNTTPDKLDALIKALDIYDIDSAEVQSSIQYLANLLQQIKIDHSGNYTFETTNAENFYNFATLLHVTLIDNATGYYKDSIDIFKEILANRKQFQIVAELNSQAANYMLSKYFQINYLYMPRLTNAELWKDYEHNRVNMPLTNEDLITEHAVVDKFHKIFLWISIIFGRQYHTD